MYRPRDAKLYAGSYPRCGNENAHSLSSRSSVHSSEVSDLYAFPSLIQNAIHRSTVSFFSSSFSGWASAQSSRSSRYVPPPTTDHDRTLIQYFLVVSQYRWLHKDYEDVQKLRYAYIAKAIIATALIVLAFAFAIGLYTNVDVGGQSSKSRLCGSRRLIRLSPQPYLNGSLPLDIVSTCSRSGTTSVYPRG